MALSAVDSSKTQPQESVCPHCGRSVDTARTPLLTVVLLFVFFGAISVALWSYFRFRPARATEQSS